MPLSQMYGIATRDPSRALQVLVVQPTAGGLWGVLAILYLCGMCGGEGEVLHVECFRAGGHLPV